jgi:ferric-dicitrate binding protein FerR (iron transport regulator)
MAEAVGAAPPARADANAPPPAVAPGFDRGAAMAALARAAAAASVCGGSPADSGRAGATITFAPSGAAEVVVVDGSSLSPGASACVERAFRAARVPAFAGPSVRVHRSFTMP